MTTNVFGMFINKNIINITEYVKNKIKNKIIIYILMRDIIQSLCIQ